MFLELLDVHSYYDKSHILQGVDLQLQLGEMVCLLGRNGVGKTTTLKSIMGMVTPAQGRILLDGKDVVGLLSYQIARLGVGIVPEDRRIFPSLSASRQATMRKHPAKISGTLTGRTRCSRD
jgi:branched-chain amino acid transport system ATP-binding protein